MIGTHFNHDTLRRYTAAFGSLFNDITIKRYTNGVAVKEIPVPLFLGNSHKYVSKKNNDYSTLSETKLKTILPRMAFSFIGMQYNPQRQPNKNQILVSNGNMQYNRVPYDFIYQLEIKVKNIADGNQIVEQICPFFSPYLQISMIDNVDLNTVSDIQIMLDSSSPEDSYTGSLDDTREIKWDLNFTVQGWLYKPTLPQGGIIKQVNVGLFDDYTGAQTEDIQAAVNPLTAGELDQHTIDVTITNL